MKLILSIEEAEKLIMKVANVEGEPLEVVIDASTAIDIDAEPEEVGPAPWEPGEYPPQSRDEFLAWAEGKKVTGKFAEGEWYHSLRADPNNHTDIIALDILGAEHNLLWSYAGWEEYKDPQKSHPLSGIGLTFNSRDEFLEWAKGKKLVCNFMSGDKYYHSFQATEDHPDCIKFLNEKDESFHSAGALSPIANWREYNG